MLNMLLLQRLWHFSNVVSSVIKLCNVVRMIKLVDDFIKVHHISWRRFPLFSLNRWILRFLEQSCCPSANLCRLCMSVWLLHLVLLGGQWKKVKQIFSEKLLKPMINVAFCNRDPLQVKNYIENFIEELFGEN